MDDREIMGLFFARDERAIEACREKYGRLCYSIAYNILRSPEDAEECVSDTYLRAWWAIPPQKPERLGAYLARICRNAALNKQEKSHAQKRQGEVLLAEGELELCLPDRMDESIDKILLSGLLGRFLGSLRPDSRRIFVLRYWYFYSVKEIAQRLSMGESRVKMSLMRTRSALGKFLEKEGFEI